LELLDRLRHRGGGEAEIGGRATEAALLGDAHEWQDAGEQVGSHAHRQLLVDNRLTKAIWSTSGSRSTLVARAEGAMNIGVLGAEVVAKAVAGKLAALGHSIMLGTRDVRATLERSGNDHSGGPPVRPWLEANPEGQLLT